LLCLNGLDEKIKEKYLLTSLKGVPFVSCAIAFPAAPPQPPETPSNNNLPGKAFSIRALASRCDALINELNYTFCMKWIDKNQHEMVLRESTQSYAKMQMDCCCK